MPNNEIKKRASIFFKEQSPTFDVTLAFMLFCIIYSARSALTFGLNNSLFK